MESQMEQKPIRQVMLEVVAALSKNGHNLQTNSTLSAVAQQVGGTSNPATQQAILRAWYDLFSSGHALLRLQPIESGASLTWGHSD